MKERSSKLDAHADRLTDWFGQEKITLTAARERLRSQFSCSVSLNMLSRWWQHRCQIAMQNKLLGDIAAGAAFNRTLEKQFEANPAPEHETLMRLVKTLTAEIAVKGGADPDTLRLVATLVSLSLEDRKAAGSYKLKEQDLALKERRVVLLEEKAAKLDQVEKTVTSEMTAGEKEARIRQIFGLA